MKTNRFGHEQHEVAPAAQFARFRRDTERQNDVRSCITSPSCLQYLGYREVGRLAFVARRWCFLASWYDTAAAGTMWHAVCLSLAYEFGVYVPNLALHEWRDLFFGMILPARDRWGVAPTIDADSFKLRVSIRFRPGAASEASVMVPLHQRLLVLKAGETLMEAHPEKYCCALLGGLMRDPVMLPSGRVCERQVVVLQLRRSKKDPFTKVPLSKEMLVPQEQLKAEIREWRENEGGVNVRDKEHLKVNKDGLAKLSKQIGGDAALELFDAVVDAERLIAKTKRKGKARPKASSALRQLDDYDDDFSEHSSDGEQDAEEETEAETAQATTPAAPEEENFCVLTKQQTHEETARVQEQRHTAEARARDKPRVLEVGPNKVIVFQPGKGAKPFLFSNCWDGGDDAEVYANTAQPALFSVMNGKNACVMCYGQTGSGKTHTMFGADPSRPSGVAMQTLCDMFPAVESLRSNGVETKLTVRYVQIYCKSVSCLLTGSKIDMLTRDIDGVPTLHMKGSMERTIACMQDVHDVFAEGASRKRFAETKMNRNSSRAHTVLMVEVTQTLLRDNITKSGVLTLVDLAGSERVKKSGAGASHTQLFREAVSINQSLLTLGRCIEGMVRGSAHLPFRESRLTQVVEPALIGGKGCVTSVIVCCRMDEDHASETLQSLFFAESCSSVSAGARLAAASPTSAIQWIDSALAKLQQQQSDGPSEAVEELSRQIRVLKIKRDRISALSKTVVSP